MKLRSLVLAGLLLLMLGGLLAGAPSQAAAIQGEEIRIGFIIPQAGPIGFHGRQQMLTLELVQEDLAKQGNIAGLKLKPIVYDSQSKPQEAINAARRLIARDNVLVIVGPFLSAEAEVTFPVVNQAAIPIISPSSAKPGIAAKNRPWTFRTAIPTNMLYEKTVKKWVAEKKIKNVVVIYNNQDAINRGDGEMVYPSLLEPLGVKIVDKVSHPTAAFDFSAQVTRAISHKPDGIVLSSLPEESGLVIREVRRQGFNGPVLGNISFEQRAVDKAGKLADGAWTQQSFWTGSSDARVQNFVKRIVERSERNVNPAQESAAFYDAIFILKKVIEEEGITNDPAKIDEDRRKIRDGLAKLKDFPGISGKTTMRPDGDVDKEAVMLKVVDGKLVPIQ